jgi:transcriptional regulator with XRE-family HTH domain
MAGQQGAGNVGGMLRAARERRGLSLRQLSNNTKIAMITLEALERNDMARLPGGIFSRGFVRSYAIEVGLDPEIVIQAFMGQFPHDSVTVGYPTSSQIEDHEAVESDRRMATTLLRLIAISIPVAAVAVYFTAAGRRSAVSGPSAVDGQRAAVGGQQSVSDVRTSAAANPMPGGVASPATVPADRLVVQVSVARQSWISAIVDGSRAAQREFKPGEEATFEVGKEIILTAGDAAGVVVMLNGMPARRLGGNGQVVTLRVNPTNFKNYLVTP